LHHRVCHQNLSPQIFAAEPAALEPQFVFWLSTIMGMPSGNANPSCTAFHFLPYTLAQLLCPLSILHVCCTLLLEIPLLAVNPFWLSLSNICLPKIIAPELQIWFKSFSEVPLWLRCLLPTWMLRFALLWVCKNKFYNTPTRYLCPRSMF
jgi:hypothetical protein